MCRKPSSKLGLLGEPDNLAIVGEGAPLQTGPIPMVKGFVIATTKAFITAHVNALLPTPMLIGDGTVIKNNCFMDTLCNLSLLRIVQMNTAFSACNTGARHDSVTLVFF